ncbi:glutathione S-transferase family protein [Eilatimonas milleporae]|uniref:Putative glutathione S-transferase n=1 Tax=Eilatimonas milleporae TaxID=911205 RepID=A0A3M0CT93_9PROT|nr:glutathione S-transferase family protein [Eilatimonas milleporae]RMB12688.1 putative glutathione S-transferase [Eilatimonas milleporae]
MGLLVDGTWRDEWYDTASTGGRFVRRDSQFRHQLGEEGFEAAPGRYHLYVSYACPWAHRTLIVRALKGLEDMIGVSAVSPIMLEHGWTYDTGEGSTGDTVNGTRYHHELYTRAKPDYSGRVTVPVLWDTKTNTIVNNESSDIIRMFNTAFDSFGARAGNFYPEDLRQEIDTVNERVYDTVNNGVYKAGFATTQAAYEEALGPLFDTLDWLEERLSTQRFLVGTQLTEADIRLFTTLVRFDPVYHGHFKTNLRRVEDYPSLWAYTRDIYQTPGIARTVNMDHIKRHYYASHRTINPTGIVPMGTGGDLTLPHGRDGMTA